MVRPFHNVNQKTWSGSITGKSAKVYLGFFVRFTLVIIITMSLRYHILYFIIDDYDSSVEQSGNDDSLFQKRLFHKPSEYDMDKVKTTLRQFVRDWSEAGAEERARCYTPVINEIKKHFPPDQW